MVRQILEAVGHIEATVEKGICRPDAIAPQAMPTPKSTCSRAATGRGDRGQVEQTRPISTHQKGHVHRALGN